jgi:hypothetical protein
MAVPSLHALSGMDVSSLVAELIDGIPLTEDSADQAVILGESDSWVTRFIALGEREEAEQAYEEYLMDLEADKAYEEEVCWGEFEEWCLRGWEERLLVATVCLELQGDYGFEQGVMATPKFMWALHNGGAEIDSWFLQVRTDRECDEAFAGGLAL